MKWLSQLALLAMSGLALNLSIKINILCLHVTVDNHDHTLSGNFSIIYN